MEAKFQVNKQQDKKNRKNLADIVPLSTPLSVQIELASACNFKCAYCLHSSKKLSTSGFKSGIMDYSLFTVIVDMLKKFPDKLEFISLQSRGESFLNKRLPDMIAYLKQANVTKEIAINTNASLLTPEVNKAIVDAGLDYIRISIQGVNSGQYQKTSGVDVDFDKLVGNIENLYKQKNNLYIYIKIIDMGLSDEDKNKFINTFEPISDSLFIETPMDFWVGADLDVAFANSRYGYESKKVMVCPRIFFAMVIHYDGTVVACDADWEETLPVGSIRDSSLVDIWNNEKFVGLRKEHLSLKGRSRALCDNCPVINNCEMDNIDEYANILLGRY